MCGCWVAQTRLASPGPSASEVRRSPSAMKDARMRRSCFIRETSDYAEDLFTGVAMHQADGAAFIAAAEDEVYDMLMLDLDGVSESAYSMLDEVPC